MLVVKINFTNSLYVSSSPIKDKIGLKILEPNFFIATRDGLAIDANFTLDNYTLPSQSASEEDY